MSRGIGKVQSSILKRLRECSDSTTLESLRWDLAEIDGDTDLTTQSLPSANNVLSASWNTSVARAVHKLAKCDPKRILLTKRKLTSTAEFLLHYPNKTLSARTRFLRQKLLPILLDDSNSGFRPVYSRAMNESYYLTKRDSPPSIRKAAKIWKQSEAELISLLPRTASDVQQVLFFLICKGKQLLLSGEITAKDAFADYSDALMQKGILSPALAERVNNIRQLLLPKHQEQHLNLKSKLYSLASFGDRGSKSSLKSESVRWLNDKYPEFLEKLPGYEGPPESKGRWRLINPDIKCPELDKLIDATALQAFRFLEIA